MKKYSFLLLVIGLTVLVITQQKVIMPLVMEVIKSDAFLVQSKDNASQFPISTELSDIAFKHCNSYIQTELGSNTTIHFPKKPIHAWTLGNYQYVVNAEISINNDTTTAVTKKYVCRITYKNSDNQEGINQFDNWSIEGLSGIENT
jgi:hypothetical protein